MNSLNHSKGATLLEILLVMGIGSAILILGVNQYNSFKVHSEASRVQSNVDELFNAMAFYYKKNCYGSTVPQLDGTIKLVPGTLNPSVSPPNSVAIDFNADLKTPGLLSGYLNAAAFPLSKYVDDASAVGTNGYVLQFNKETSNRTINTCTNLICTASVNIGAIIIWRMQVAVALTNPSLAVQSLLGADCLSSLAPDKKTVEPCKSNKTGSYAVWERLPSLSSMTGSSTYGPTMRTVTQFTQMYTTDPILVLTDQSFVANQNYLCTN